MSIELIPVPIEQTVKVKPQGKPNADDRDR